ncbi:bacteriocin class II family protein [Streptococcus equi subsp. zooepidemicus]|uniref:bacteriocin class II family protein n=1 Tax=Streptococcus equi TaxID=1336 RepID=UPI0013F692BD|nr:bacteriocin class II family protein [Streptococcus equi]MCD3433235.1 bacteriocin class II family protein [Streptococcus equi subsp. zooepidemicus]MDI5953892.1 bacteriocin class II family protein [Streptococcus equi subsp. zooepidemicus]QTZ59422.1 hypothetical protein MCPGFBBE_01528 [Streptococcus equi subsp. zooepidemicus]QUF62081.1 Blp family class II bacteriocin [Streptococcus equi subsp. zooepidemicus]QWN60778.1 Blp family class II bacteriocin [Streptococcus equi subsp. zooepidemicus]
MNTTLMKHFEIIDTDKLAHIEGGKVNWGKVGVCAAGIAAGMGEGYMTTAGSTLFLGPYAVGTGVVGAAIGGIGGALTC